MTKKEQEKKEVERLCKKSSFSSSDIVSLVNLYRKYINRTAAICTSCTSNLRHHVNVFQRNKDNMLKQIEG